MIWKDCLFCVLFVFLFNKEMRVLPGSLSAERGDLGRITGRLFSKSCELTRENTKLF